MEIFVTGATGYIGLEVAQAFRRAGHRVSGLARSQAAATTLMRAEIAPVLGALETPERYHEAVRRADVIVHAAIDYSADTAALDTLAIKAVLAAAKEAGAPKRVIYTSGAWVYGAVGAQPADEDAPLHPAQAVAWRPAVEQLVLTAAHVRGIVMRPGVVYGKRGGLTGAWFAGAAAADLSIVGDGANRWAMVHVDDLAEAYVRAGEAAQGGEVFNLSDGSSATVAELAHAAGAAAGYTGPLRHVPLSEATAQMGALAEALALDQQLHTQRAQHVLDWHPQHRGFIAEAVTYYAAWRAWAA